MPIDRARIHGNGWCQGRLFDVADSARLIEEANPPPYLSRVLPSGFRLIVASHTCDILSRRDDEPNVDVYPVVPLPTGVNPQQTAVRNARCLHVPVAMDGKDVPCEIFAPSRFCIARNRLAEMAPDFAASLSERYLKQFVAWLAQRFARTAFPDEFNARFDAVKKEIRKVLNESHDGFCALLIDIDPFDESPREERIPYKVSLLALMYHSDHLDPHARAAVTAIAGRIEEIMKRCKLPEGGDAFTVDTSEIRSDATLSVADYRNYYPFGFEDLSLRDGVDTPPQMF